MILKLKRTPGLYLVGFMCSGKSCVGSALAERIGWDFVDIDSDIEARCGMTISQIFSAHGEVKFRQLESDALRTHVAAIEAGNPRVVALGGGAFVQRDNRELLENNGVTVWLDCSLESIEARLGADVTRPLAADRAAMRHLFELRKPFYAAADYRVDSGSGDVPDVVARILSLPLF